MWSFPENIRNSCSKLREVGNVLNAEISSVSIRQRKMFKKNRAWRIFFASNNFLILFFFYSCLRVTGRLQTARKCISSVIAVDAQWSGETPKDSVVNSIRTAEVMLNICCLLNSVTLVGLPSQWEPQLLNHDSLYTRYPRNVENLNKFWSIFNSHFCFPVCEHHHGCQRQYIDWWLMFPDDFFPGHTSRDSTLIEIIQ